MAFVTLTDLEGRRTEAELLSQREGQQFVRLKGGQTLSLPEDALVKQHTGDYYLLLKLSELEALSERGADQEAEGVDEAVIPVSEERAVVRKQQLEGATVRVTKAVRTEEQTVDEALVSEEIEVERIRIDSVVDAPEPIRTEGDTTIIPLYEEVLVVEKRLVLTEEVRVSKRRTERREPQRVTLRREEVSVERFEAEKGVGQKDEGQL